MKKGYLVLQDGQVFEGIRFGAEGDTVGELVFTAFSGSHQDAINKGVRYMEMAEGYVIKMALDEEGEVIGYQFVKVGKMLEDIRHGVSPDEAYKKNIGTYGRFDGAAKYIDPREE